MTDSDGTAYTRIKHPGSNAPESRPNVVLVICESFSMYKSSMSGNPLNSTPYFNSLTKEGVFFKPLFFAYFRNGTRCFRHRIRDPGCAAFEIFYP